MARGETVRAVSLPAWAVWAGAGACAAALAWLIGSTVYIAFHDEISEAARAHRISVERAYEDRIATLRRQIDEINTRQFLDQQAFEGRLEAMLRRQAALEERQRDIAGLYDDARARRLSINLEPPGRQVAAGGRSSYSLVTAAHAASFDPSRPAPLDPASAPPEPDSGLPAIDRIEASIDRVEHLQGAMLGALESTVAGLSERLVEVSDAIGAELPEGAADGATGGPLVELRRLDGPTAPDRQIERIREDIGRFDALRDHVSHLPVRSPLAGAIELTSGFGTRLDPFLRRPALHTGLDFRAQSGTPVHATAAGRVVVASYAGGYGRLVEIDHGNGYVTRYGHLSRITVEAGADVAPGDVVGLVGSTGRSTGPHLHYETRVGGSARNPVPFVEVSELVPEGY